MKSTDLVLVLLVIAASLLLILAPWPCTVRDINQCGGVLLSLEAKFSPHTSPKDQQKLLKQAISVLEKRARLFKIKARISQVGDNTILVQLPGITDADWALRLVASTALLEFRKVVRYGPPGETFTDERDEEVLSGYECSKPELQDKCLSYVVKKEPLMIVTGLQKATVKSYKPQPISSLSQVYIHLEFNDAGAHQFRDVILQLKPEWDSIAIVFDRVVYSAPLISRSLYDEARRKPKIDQAVIEGSFTSDEARLLAAILSAGALPVELTITHTEIRSKR